MCGSVDWVLACKSKGQWFDSWSGHMPGLQSRSPVGGAQETTTHWCFSPSLPSLKINKHLFIGYLFIFREGKGGRKDEKHRLVALHAPPASIGAWNTCMCLDWALSWWPCHWWDDTQPSQSGLSVSWAKRSLLPSGFSDCFFSLKYILSLINVPTAVN